MLPKMVVFGHLVLPIGAVLPMVLPISNRCISNRCHPPFAVSKELPKMVVLGHLVLPIGAVMPIGATHLLVELPISNRCHPPFG
jgi:hypothetical protein